MGVVNSSWCFIDFAREGHSGVSMECRGRISRTVVKPTCMGKPLASSNREIVNSVRRLLAIDVNRK